MDTRPEPRGDEPPSMARFPAVLDRAHAEIALLKEELCEDARWKRLPSRRRPHYTAIERLRILEVRAAWGQRPLESVDYSGLR